MKLPFVIKIFALSILSGRLRQVLPYCLEKMHAKQRQNAGQPWDGMINPLYTNGFVLLDLMNKPGIFHCTYLGVSGYD